MHFFVFGTLARHMFSTGMGLIITLYLYGEKVVHVIVMSGAAYAMMKFLPRASQANYVFVFVMTYLGA